MKYLVTVCVILVCLVSLSLADVNQCSREGNTSNKPVRRCSREYTVPYTPGARQGGVLFVEEPGNDGFGPVNKPDTVWNSVLTEILGAGNYGWYGPTLNPSDNGPDLATMQGYDLVIWNTYDYWWQDTAALTATDQDNLGQYMEGGGKVWLISQDGLYSGIPYSWMNIYFGLADANEDYIFGLDSVQLNGLAELSGITLWSVCDFPSNPFYPDELIPDASAWAVVEDLDNGPEVGIFYDAGVWYGSFWGVDARVQPGTAFWGDWVDMVTAMLGPDLFNVGIAETPSQTPVGRLQLAITPAPIVRTATISYTLPIADDVKLQVFNKLGQRVRTLVNAHTPAGSHKVTWNATDARGNDVPNGVYFVRLTCGDSSTAANVVVVK